VRLSEFVIQPGAAGLLLPGIRWLALRAHSGGASLSPREAKGLATIEAGARRVTISVKVLVDMAERTTAEARRQGLTVSAVIGKTIVIPAPVIAPVSSF
jgi:hypothetical protein